MSQRSRVLLRLLIENRISDNVGVAFDERSNKIQFEVALSSGMTHSLAVSPGCSLCDFCTRRLLRQR